MAPVIAELGRYPDCIHPVVCVTGQHRQMLDQVLDLYGIVPDYDLDVMQHNQSLSHLTAVLCTSLDGVLAKVRPDWMLAQGDTTTVLAAALVAFYHRVRFGHVEAGLRTGDKLNPFPEEMNRRLADDLADLLFAPTPRSRQALLNEGQPTGKILVTGNTVVDALLAAAAQPYDWATGPLAGLPKHRRLVLVTAHRRESFGAALREICLAVRDLALEFGPAGVHFVYPVHLNPQVREQVSELLSGLPNVSLLEPLDYLSMVNLMKRAALLLTDSGGLQEEAPSLGVPVLVMRDRTERTEGLEAGVVRLVGTQRARIVSEVRASLCDAALHTTVARRVNPYGDGHAASRIVSALLHYSTSS